VMACGANCCGQLGLGSLQPSRVPQVVAALAGREIVSIACGSEHSVAAARGGEVWAWGRNIHGQLGNMVHPFHVRPPDYPRELLPVLMVFQPAVAGVEVRQVACGRDHTVVLFEDGRLWGCGHNFKFQLGIEHGQNAYYATCMSSVWSRYVQFDQEEEPPPKEPEVMSIEEYTRRVSEGQKKLSMRQGHLGVHGYFFQEDAGREEQPGQQSEADAPKVLEVACGEEHTVALLDNGHVVC
jgi:alpha-tubulin suppressor-like RCC1 family protein